MDYVTLNEAGRRGPIPTYRLRQMQKAGNLVGFFSGNRFYLDYDVLLEEIKRESQSRKSGGQLV